ncbi:MAG TPA: hypothetical protein VK435_10805, partial [Thermodesulfovibrionales bacterium]|nr:hypothetical protein [Thermodesulfovibrionales bacterium]
NNRDFLLKRQKELIVVINNRKIDLYIPLNADILKPFRGAFPFGFIGELAGVREIVLMIGVLNMGKQFGPSPAQPVIFRNIKGFASKRVRRGVCFQSWQDCETTLQPQLPE